MKVRLNKYRIKSGKTERVDEWMEFLNQNMDKVLLILKNENLHIETMFREKSDEGEYLYWYAVQGESEPDATLTEDEITKKNEIIKKHMEYWEECIDQEYQATPIVTDVVMVPENIEKNMV
ncbi:DUF6176 family protein [Chengkuizengella axinellae]|uniref:DUF6176 family protein n=1 Tax=Chengkuizengella axinellae TaxID=3064388 RepID=A0ABT9J035_9BACL|nr:DUF6176 family protein [Chengkuizengella sp. 2205SS18-9]MDP5274974.1 DUF6176 family protein [Chengkuizengella sp. 2205SS18-9]